MCMKKLGLIFELFFFSISKFLQVFSKILWLKSLQKVKYPWKTNNLGETLVGTYFSSSSNFCNSTQLSSAYMQNDEDIIMEKNLTQSAGYCSMLSHNLISYSSETFKFHTPLEELSGSGQCPRLMAFTQLFFGISGTQNRRDQNFLTSTFSVIAILRYPTFPYCFYYIAILQLGHFREIFTIFLASSDRMYLESYNFLRLFLTYIAINW